MRSLLFALSFFATPVLAEQKIRVIDLGASTLDSKVKAPEFTWIESHQKFKNIEDQLLIKRLQESETYFLKILEKSESSHVRPE